jgi:hypothetical protein
MADRIRAVVLVSATRKKWADPLTRRCPNPLRQPPAAQAANKKEAKTRVSGSNGGGGLSKPKWVRLHAESDTAKGDIMSWIFDVFTTASDSSRVKAGDDDGVLKTERISSGKRPHSHEIVKVDGPTERVKEISICGGKKQPQEAESNPASL